MREILGVGDRLDLREDSRPRTDHTTRVRDALSTRAARDAGDIARRTGMAIEQVESVLGMLQLEGAAVHSPAGWRMTPSDR